MADPTVKVVIEVDDKEARQVLIRTATLLSKLRRNARNFSNELKGASREATNELKKQSDATQKASDKTRELGRSSRKTSNDMRSLSQATSQFLRSTLSSISGVSQLARQLVLQAQAAGLNSNQIRAVAQATGVFSREQVALIGRSAKLTAAFDGLNRALSRGTINQRQYGEALASVTSKYNDVIVATQRASQQQSSLNAAQQQNQGVLRGLIGGYVRLRIALDAIRQAAQAVARTLVFAEEGAQIQQTAISFDNFANNIAGIPDLLDQLTAAADGTVSEFQLLTSTLTLTAGVSPKIATELAQASPQLLEIARAAAIINPAPST